MEKDCEASDHVLALLPMNQVSMDMLLSSQDDCEDQRRSKKGSSVKCKACASATISRYFQSEHIF